MKKILIGLLTLALLLVGTAFADQEDAPVLLVQLPEDAQMVENVVQLLRYMQSDVTLDGLVAGDWPGATNVQAMSLETIGGCNAQGILLNVSPEDDEALHVALVLVSADSCTLVYQAVYPQRLGIDQIDDAVQRMVNSMDVLGGTSAQDVG